MVVPALRTSLPSALGSLLLACALAWQTTPLACAPDRARAGATPPGGGQDAAAEAPDLRPSDQGSGPDGDLCRIDSDCPPGTYCDEGRCGFDCRLHSDCGRNGFVCENGRCVATVDCADDQGCRPPETICEGFRCVAGCLERGCGVGLRCAPVTGRCVGGAPDECAADSDCQPPQTLCVGLRCVPGCLDLGCGAGLRCQPQTGRCEPEEPERCEGDGDCPAELHCVVATGRCEPEPDPDPCHGDADCPGGQHCVMATGRCEEGERQNIPLGDDCPRGDACASGMCEGLTVAGQPAQICTSLCCSEFDCPAGTGCLYFSGVQLCLPSRIFPPGWEFTAAVGQSCGPGGNSCRSGLCYVQDDRCMQSCCTNADCGAAPCSWSSTGNTLRSFCDGVALLGDPPGAFCDGTPFGCQSGICLPDANSPIGGVCAAPCCSEQDCPGSQGCVQVAGPWGPVGAQGSITYACLEVPRGQQPLGEACAGPDDGAACVSGLCVTGLCSRTCCADASCPAGFTCQPASNGEGGYVRACLPR